MEKSTWKSEFESVEYMREMFRKRPEELIKFCDDGGEIFLYNCVSDPVFERPAGVIPLKMAGVRMLFGAESSLVADLLPAEADEFCELIKFSFATKIKEPYPKKMRLVEHTTCACLTKLERLLGTEFAPEYLPSYLVNRPRRVIEREYDLDFFRHEMQKVSRMAEEKGGHEITFGDMWNEIKRENRRRKQIKDIFYLQRGEVVPIKGSEFCMVNKFHDFLDIDKFLEAMDNLIEELKAKKERGESVYSNDAPRIIVCDPCFFEPEYRVGVTEPIKFVKLIEECGGAVIGQDFCAGVGDCWYPCPETGDDPFYELADYYARKIVPCPFQTPNTFRITRLETAANELDADGIIYFTVRGCRMLAVEMKKVRDYFEVRGIPSLGLTRIGDPGMEMTGQLQNRIEPFIEMLKAKKKRNRE